jgi:hypothetical protein
MRRQGAQPATSTAATAVRGVSAVPATEATDPVGRLDVADDLVLTEIVDLPGRSVGVWVELRGAKVDP